MNRTLVFGILRRLHRGAGGVRRLSGLLDGDHRAVRNAELFSTGQVRPQLQNLHAPRGAGQVPIGHWLLNSGMIAAGTTVVSLVLGSMMDTRSAVSFSRSRDCRFFLFMTQVLPEALIVVPLYAMFITLGLLNNLGGLVLANARILPAGRGFHPQSDGCGPYEIEESAIIDNCPRFGISP